MPRTYPPRRTLVAFRLDPEVLADIDTLAEAEGVDRSAMIRNFIVEAMVARERKTTPKRRPSSSPGGRAS